MQPTIGRIVHYRLSEQDAEFIGQRRAARASREGVNVQTLGNAVRAGDVFPAIVTRVWPSGCNLQVTLDGADGLWVTSRTEGTEPSTWSSPPRA